MISFFSLLYRDQYNDADDLNQETGYNRDNTDDLSKAESIPETNSQVSETQIQPDQNPQDTEFANKLTQKIKELETNITLNNYFKKLKKEEATLIIDRDDDKRVIKIPEKQLEQIREKISDIKSKILIKINQMFKKYRFKPTRYIF
jgi:uncharacterized FlaG/YvyC family protein